MALNMMNSVILCVLLAICCSARLAEKVSEDDDFVVYRIPVRAIDLHPQETGLYGEASFGRSNSKSTSNSKSSSSSTGSGKGRGIGGGSSGSGQGYGSGGGGGGGGGGGHHFGGQGGYGAGGYGSGGYGSGGYGAGRDSGYDSGRESGYTPGSYGPSHPGSSYDGDHESPKVFTTTKTYTTNSAQNTGVSDPLGDINFRLSDYLKDAPGHEHSSKYSQKLYEGYGGGSDLIGGQGGKINYGAADYGRGFGDSSYRGTPVSTADFGRALQGPSGYSSFSNPSAFTSQHVGGRFGGNAQVFGGFGSPSVHYPRAYALRHTGFGLGGGY